MTGIPINHELSALLKGAAKFGAMQMAIELGAIKENVTRSYAIKRYGKTRVDNWIKTGQVRFTQGENNRVEIKRMDLEAMDSGEQLSRYVKP